jgi:hypothetical protein
MILMVMLFVMQMTHSLMTQVKALMPMVMVTEII